MNWHSWRTWLALLVTVAVCIAAVLGIVSTATGHRDLGRGLVGVAVAFMWLPMLLRRPNSGAGTGQ